MLSIRSSGILLHPTSLPGLFGSGDFGPSSFRFVDWLVSVGQTYWQMLPLGETGPGNSPYMSSSAFAGNILLIDLEELFSQGWLESGDLVPLPAFGVNRVDFESIKKYRAERLRLAAKRFFAKHDRVQLAEFHAYCEREKGWLEDYALFNVIGSQHPMHEWREWPEEFVGRDAGAIASFKNAFPEELNFWKFSQWCFSRQWEKLKGYANQRGVRIVGDVPIFVAYHSADVWSNQELFELDSSGKRTVVAGVPPDYFSETGQLWGNPLYRWDAHEGTGYDWWISRMRHAFSLFDLVRVDHFRGFANYWAVPADEPTAMNGSWMPGPGEKLFDAFIRTFGELPIIAEDLGLITPDVIELRDKFELPGMRILQFAFGDDDRNYFLPHHYVANSVAYTGTHDNDTTLGWWSTASEHERSFAMYYLGCDGKEMNWTMISALSGSAAYTVIFPLQDIIGLGSEHRMNFPGTSEGNWEWRFAWDQLNSECAARLSDVTRKNRRDPRSEGT